jgi:hypothetical protein
MSENEPKREPQISVPLDSDTLARIRAEAQREDRSVASFARRALMKELEQRGAAA